jgi:DNA-binding response OmpR family regulator
VRILLVEDEARVAGFMAKGLRDHAYAVDLAADGEEALYCAGSTEYDFIILDVMLPALDGYAVCRKLRCAGLRTPILMVTARDSIDDRVTGLDCGADDYLTKPFDLKELLARLRALGRRAATLRPELLRVADLELSTALHTAARAGRSITLTAKEYALLEFLMLNENRVVDREEIAQHVWDERFDPFSNTIDVHIRRLRAKIDLGSTNPLIHTRRGEGYVLSSGGEGGGA